MKRDRESNDVKSINCAIRLAFSKESVASLEAGWNKFCFGETRVLPQGTEPTGVVCRLCSNCTESGYVVRG